MSKASHGALRLSLSRARNQRRLVINIFFLYCSNLSRHSDNKHTKELRIWLNLKRNNIANRNPRNLNQMKCVVVCISLLPSALVVVLPRIGSERQLQTLETPRHAKSLSKMCLIASFSRKVIFFVKSRRRYFYSRQICGKKFAVECWSVE